MSRSFHPSLLPRHCAAASLVVAASLASPIGGALADQSSAPVVPTLGAATVFTDDDILARVNGRPIPSVSLENVRRQIEDTEQAADSEAILNELIDMEILAQAAEQDGLDRRPEIASALMLQYTQTLANAWLAEQNAALSIDEAQLRAEYDRQVEALDDTELRVSHILLEDEAAAREVISALAEGERFGALAVQRSEDANGAGGGALGWLKPSAMDEAMSAALLEMAPGETSAEPVRTDFGWHVLRLDDTREASLPDFEAVKPGLTNLLVRQQLAERVAQLRDAAEIERR